MTDEQLYFLRELVNRDERTFRRCLRIETVAVCLVAVFMGFLASMNLRPANSAWVRAVDLICFAVSAFTLRSMVGQWRISRRILRELAAARERLELERLSRL